jgi:hypothetical protein
MMQASLGVRLVLVTAVLVAATACERKPDDKRDTPAAPTAATTKKHDCEEAHGKPAGPPIELGTTACGAFTVKAARDDFPMKPGCDSPIDVWLTGGSAKIVAVRFWIGLEDAKGSLKARAAIENPAEPNHWHTHAEIPDPIPAGSKIWVEIEAEGSPKAVCSFDPKM